MPRTLKSLYPHLNDEDIKNIETFNANYNIDNTITESDELLLKNLKDEADILNPVLPSTGWRASDIDALNNLTDSRLQNIIASRLTSLGSDPVHNFTDEQLLDVVIRRNLSSSQVADYAQEYQFLSAESQRILDEIKQSEQTHNSSQNE